MKICGRTIDILKNFSVINPSIYVRPGNQLATITPLQTIVAKAEVDETFDQEFAIYNLSRFLGTISLFTDPEFEFGENSVTIKAGNQRVNYTYADPSMIVTPPNKDIKFPDPDVEFDITNDNLQSIQKASAVLQTPEVAFVGEDGTIFVKTLNSKDPTADVFSIAVGETTEDFSVTFKVENLKLIPNDYHVSLTTKGIAKFEAPRLNFWIATQAAK